MEYCICIDMESVDSVMHFSGNFVEVESFSHYLQVVYPFQPQFLPGPAIRDRLEVEHLPVVQRPIEIQAM